MRSGVALAAVVIALSATVARAQPVGCCACLNIMAVGTEGPYDGYVYGGLGISTESACSNDAAFCTGGSAQTDCLNDLHGEFIPFTPNTVCQLAQGVGARCVLLAQTAPAFSPRVMIFVAAALALIGYRFAVRRRVAR